jgi:hypothetical protein
VSARGNVADFEPGQILRALEAHHVRYVVVGAIATIAAGTPILTTDLDVTPECSRENLERLALALRDLDATPQGARAPPMVCPSRSRPRCSRPPTLGRSARASAIST